MITSNADHLRNVLAVCAGTESGRRLLPTPVAEACENKALSSEECYVVASYLLRQGWHPTLLQAARPKGVK